jgi:hypothetical protein
MYMKTDITYGTPSVFSVGRKIEDAVRDTVSECVEGLKKTMQIYQETGVQTKTGTQHLPNPSSKHYRFVTLFGV